MPIGQRLKFITEFEKKKTRAALFYLPCTQNPTVTTRIPFDNSSIKMHRWRSLIMVVGQDLNEKIDDCGIFFIRFYHGFYLYFFL
jgi:hypothetical protein